MDLYDPGVGATRLGELVMHLPPGCALWQSIGGPLSITAEAEHLRWIEYDLRVVAWQNTKDGSNGSNQPKPPERIPYASDRAAKAATQAEKGNRWQNIQRAREARAAQQRARELEGE